jgi:hypothetical protein
MVVEVQDKSHLDAVSLDAMLLLARGKAWAGYRTAETPAQQTWSTVYKEYQAIRLQVFVYRMRGDASSVQSNE